MVADHLAGFDEAFDGRVDLRLQLAPAPAEAHGPAGTGGQGVLAKTELLLQEYETNETLLRVRVSLNELSLTDSMS